MRFVKVDANGYFIADSTIEDSDTVLHTASDGTKPDGMRKARYVNGSWVDEEAAQLAADLAAQAIAADNARVMKELEAIDIASVRSIREWLVAQPNPPQFIVDHEAAAQAKRAQLK